MSIFAQKMLSARRKKEIISLKLKKYRQRYSQFLVEGQKSVMELCQSDFKIEEILITQKVFDKIGHQYPKNNLLIISEQEANKISNVETSSGIIAVSNFKESDLESIKYFNNFTIMLEDIMDPGNLGTIIRTADWFGISNIICSPNCVDLYNPKTIISSMGSFTRVNVHYTPLIPVLKSCKVPTYACIMDGLPIQSIAKPKEGLIIIGNESHGLSDELLKHVKNNISISRIGKAESLNAAIAMAIVCHTFIAQ